MYQNIEYVRSSISLDDELRIDDVFLKELFEDEKRKFFSDVAKYTSELRRQEFLDARKHIGMTEE